MKILFANSTTSIAIGGSVFNYYENFDSMQEKFYNIFYKFSLYFQISNCAQLRSFKNRNISFHESNNLFHDGKVANSSFADANYCSRVELPIQSIIQIPPGSKTSLRYSFPLHFVS